VIQNRIDVYNTQTAPVAGFYKTQGKHKSINGIGSVDDVSKRLFHNLEEVIA